MPTLGTQPLATPCQAPPQHVHELATGPQSYLSLTLLLLRGFPLLLMTRSSLLIELIMLIEFPPSLSLSVKGFLNLMGVIVMHTLSDVNAVL